MRFRHSFAGAVLVAALCIPASASGTPRIQLTLDTSEADRVLSILAQRAAGKVVGSGQFRLLFATEPYRRLKQREQEIARLVDSPNMVLTDDDFRQFVLHGDFAWKVPELRATLQAWKKAHLEQVAERVLAYLPDSAVIRAKVYPVIKPDRNSFAWDVSTDPAIFLYLDPDVSAAGFARTVAHELHHIGLASVQTEYDRKIGALPERAVIVAEWIGAFGEGMAMLAAAGGPDSDPLAASSARERVRWKRNLANFSRDLSAINGFFLDVLNGRLAGRDAVTRKGFSFYGRQGPWYTVGYRMAVMVERRSGRPALVRTMLDPPRLLLLYNQAAAEQNAEGRERLPLWSQEILKQVGANEE